VNAHCGALHLVAGTLAEAIRPVPSLPFRQWMEKNIVLVDGPRRGELWSLRDAPYLGEIADCLSQEHPCNWVTVRKAQQTGVSILALAWSLYIADICPDNILYGVPGIDALQDVNSKKLQPLIDAAYQKTKRRIIEPVTSRSGYGSTIYEKRFSGGVLSLANANSVMDLSSKTCRRGIRDELSKWQDTPNGDDPESLFFGRFTAFRREKDYKIFDLSTPEYDTGDELGDTPGHCRIDRRFRRSDQRYFNIQCAECAEFFVQSYAGLHLDRAHPHKSEHGCPNCGHLVSESERVFALRNGAHYKPTKFEPDRHPGFHVDAFISLMMSYEAIAEEVIEAERSGETGMKKLFNLFLALPFAMKGNAPDHIRLFERRDMTLDMRGVIPADGLILVAGVDVQHDGLYFEAVAFGEDRQSWSVESEFLAGATDDINAGAWLELEALRVRDFRDAWGATRRIEAMAVDGGDGNRVTQVFEWCRQRPGCYAVKGVPGRGAPAIVKPALKSVNKRGKGQRIRGVLLWGVGTWSLKHEFYGNLHKSGKTSGGAIDPPGYCHFGQWQELEFFLQLTAEYFKQTEKKGKFHEEWAKLRKDNHFLDARIYAMAMAEHLGLSRLNKQSWAALRAKLTPKAAADLFDGEAASVMAGQEILKAETIPAPARVNKWMNR
jgi:phage terminase large subunit GpA-like protein